MVAGGEAAPRSTSAINAQRAYPWAMADAGARHNQKYVTAGTSGGLAGPLREGPSR